MKTPVRRSLLVLACALAASLLLAGCGDKAAAPAPGGGPALTKVVLQTDWYAQPEHGGFYQALVKGYYRAAGLDVTIEQGGPNAMPGQNIVRGNTQFSIGRSDDLILAASRGIPLVMVGALMQRDPQALIFHPDAAIHGFKDLDGRTVMASPGASWIGFVERKYGVKLSITPLDYGLSRFLANKDLVQQSFITNEPYYLHQQGLDPGVLLLSDAGFSPYRVWYTSRDFIKQHPEVVRAFTEASIRGWSEYLNGEHREADAMIQSLNHSITPEFTTYCVAAMKKYLLVAGDPARGEVIGQIDPARIEEELKQLTEIGILTQPMQVSDVLDDEFLPAAVRAKARPR